VAWPSAPGHPYYVEVELDGSALSGNIADANTVVRLTSAIGIQADDIASRRYNIYDVNGELDYAELYYDEAGGLLTSLFAHVHLPIYASPSGDQNKVRIYFGGSPGSDQDNPTSAATTNTQNVWPLSEALSGDDAADMLGNFDFTQQNTPGAGVTGKVGDCRSFDGTNENFQDTGLTIPTTGSLSYWVNSDVTYGSDWNVPFSCSDTDYYPGFWGPTSWKDGDMYAGWILNAGNDDRAAWTMSGLSPGTWYRLTSTWENGGEVNLYVDADNKATATDTTLDATFATSGYLTMIGGINVSAPGYGMWDGKIDHIVLRTNEMTEDEVTWDHNNTGGEADYEQTVGAIEFAVVTTKTIGTSSRDYSTITAFEAALDTINTATGASHIIGECYADSAFTSDSSIDWGWNNAGLKCVTLRPASGHGHPGYDDCYSGGTNEDGDAYVTIDGSGTDDLEWTWNDTPNDQGILVIEDLIFRNLQYASGDSIYVFRDYDYSVKGFQVVRRNLVHDIVIDSDVTTWRGIRTKYCGGDFYLNNVFYNIDINGTSDGYYIRLFYNHTRNDSAGTDTWVVNNTFYWNDSAGASSTGIWLDYDYDVANYYNNLVVNCGNGNWDDMEDDGSASNLGLATNATSDTSAYPTGDSDYQNLADDDLFTTCYDDNTDADYWDLSLAASSSPAEGTTVTDSTLAFDTWPLSLLGGSEVEIDAAGNDRTGETWDVGAFQYQTVSTFTASVAATIGGATTSVSATFAPGTHTATAAPTTGGTSVAIAATFTAPVYTATAAPTTGGATAAAAATFAVGVFTASASPTTGGATAAAAATFTPPVYTASAAPTTGGTGVAIAATFTAPVYTASAAPTVGGTSVAIAATFTAPVYTATAVATTGGATAAAAATFAVGVFTASASPTTGGATAAAAATFTPPVYTASAAPTTGGTSVAIAATFTAPVYTATAAATTGGATAAAAATFAVIARATVAVETGGVTMVASATSTVQGTLILAQQTLMLAI